MPPEVMRIHARSKQQALDWSLVLTSQGIETAIEGGDSGEGWQLLVVPEEYERAVSAIEQFRTENQGWPWQRHVFRPGILFDWGSLAWVGLLALFFVLDARVGLRSAGLLDAAAVKQGQWWRLFTAIWLHVDLAHLAGNATFGFVLLGLVMARFGTGVGALAAYLAGAGGNAIAWLLSPGTDASLGASGMVMGALGLLAVQSLSLWRKTPHARKYIVGGIFGGLMLFVLLGLSPGTYVQAHLGGFLSGLLLGVVLTLMPSLAQNAAVNLGCGVIFTLLVVLPWAFALSRSSS
jgi:membrane associated rhomboid family serine protease